VGPVSLSLARETVARVIHPATRRGRALHVAALVSPLIVASACGVSVCPWALTMGTPCPGCGMTRAAIALAHGDVSTALALNPSALLTVPVSAAIVVFLVASYVYDGRSRANAPAPRTAAIATMIVLYGVWLARAFGAFGGPVSV